MNDEPPVEPRAYLHHALVGLQSLTRVPSLALVLAFVALAVGLGGLWVWVTGSALAAWIVGCVYLAFLLADGVWLASLPRRGLSYGPVQPSLVALSLVRLLLGLLPLAGCLGLPVVACAAVGAVLQGAAWGLVATSTAVEPFRLGVTHLELYSAKLPEGARLRLVQISDLHVERLTRRERAVVERVRALDADYVLLTGDYLNFSYTGEERAIRDARWVLSRLRARRGIYAVRGTHQVEPNRLLPVLFDGLPIRWLRNEHCTLREAGYTLIVAGASCTLRPDIDGPALERALAGVPHDAFSVLLFHAPVAVPQARAAGVDLYLSGHTHGGQIRVPFYGALITACATGKRFEMGRYDLEGTTLYVSRGVGMEGMAAPRARVLCPPELVCVDVHGTGQAPGE